MLQEDESTEDSANEIPPSKRSKLNENHQSNSSQEEPVQSRIVNEKLTSCVHENLDQISPLSYSSINPESSSTAASSILSAHSPGNEAAAREPDARSVGETIIQSASQMQLVRRISMENFIREGEEDAYIFGMSYNSTHDELFFADRNNKVVRSISFHDNAGDLREVYRAPQDMSPYVWSVCHMSDSDTLLVCSRESQDEWLVALTRNGSEWREAHREKTAGRLISCELSDSQVLIGEFHLDYLELFCVETGPRIVKVQRIYVTEAYECFAASCDSNILVAMSYLDHSVRVHRPRGKRFIWLEEIARIVLEKPFELLWLNDRLLVDDSNDIIELEMVGKRLKRRCKLVATSENTSVGSLIEVNDGIAFYELESKTILHLSWSSNSSINSESSSTAASSIVSAHSAGYEATAREPDTRSVGETIVQSAAQMQLVRRIPMETFTREGEKDTFIAGMSYNSARDELFLADHTNKVVRSISFHDKAGDLRDIYRAPHDTSANIWTVCHMSDSDILLVCSTEKWWGETPNEWLVALTRSDSGWRQVNREQIRGGLISCALSDDRVLIGGYDSRYLQPWAELA